jgi:hypothetical protein
MKIKIAVGIALVIFVLIVGNILAFGLLGGKNTSNINNNLNYVPQNTLSSDNKTPINTTNNNAQVQPTQPVVNQNQPSNNQHSVPITRAS